MFTSSASRVLLATTVAATLGAGSASAATLTTYDSLASWQAATSEPGWLVDFENFDVDTSFRTSSVDVGPFDLLQLGSDEFRNLIEVPPSAFMDNNGTSHASMYTDFGATTVRLTFDAPVSAFAAEFFSALDLEQLDLNFGFLGEGTQLVQLPFNGFFGVTSDTPITSILFRSRTESPGTGGEGFGMDNVRGAAADLSEVPEPSLVLLVGAGLLMARRRRV